MMVHEIIAELAEALQTKILNFQMDVYGCQGMFTFETCEEDEYGNKKTYEGCVDEDRAIEIARERLESYPEDVLGLKGIALKYFNTESFVDDAIRYDGWQSELCVYDGTNEETKNGIVYWRT